MSGDHIYAILPNILLILVINPATAIQADTAASSSFITAASYTAGIYVIDQS